MPQRRCATQGIRASRAEEGLTSAPPSQDLEGLHPQSEGEGSEQNDDRMERVRALRAALLSGSYVVSADELADCLLERMLLCGRRQRNTESVR